jgi:hypothetical protein
MRDRLRRCVLGCRGWEGPFGSVKQRVEEVLQVDERGVAGDPFGGVMACLPSVVAGCGVDR